MSTRKALVPIGILAVVTLVAIIVIQYRSKCKLPDENNCPVGEQGQLRVPFCDPSGDLAVQCKDATEVCGEKSCPAGQIATTCDYKNKKWVCKDSSDPSGGGGTPPEVKSCDVNDKGLLPFPISTDGKIIPDINNFTPTLNYKSYKEIRVGNEAACMLQACSDGFFMVSEGWCKPGDAGSGPCDTSKFKQLPGDPHKTYPDPNAYFVNAYSAPGDIKYCAYQRCSDGYAGDPCVQTAGACPDPSMYPQAKAIIRTAGGQCVITECNNDATFVYSPSSDGKSCEKTGCVNPKRKLINGLCSPDCDDLDTRAELVFGSKRGVVSDDCLKNAQVQLSADGLSCVVKPGGTPPYGYCGDPNVCPTWFVSGNVCAEGAEFERARLDPEKGCLECPPFYCKAGTTDQTMSDQTCHGFVNGCVYASGKDQDKAEGAVQTCVAEHSTNGEPSGFPGSYKYTWGPYTPGTGITLVDRRNKTVKVKYNDRSSWGWTQTTQYSNTFRIYDANDNPKADPAKSGTVSVTLEPGDYIRVKGQACYIPSLGGGQYCVQMKNDATLKYENANEACTYKMGVDTDSSSALLKCEN